MSATLVKTNQFVPAIGRNIPDGAVEGMVSVRKAKLSKLAKANAGEIEPPMPARTAKGKRTKFTDMTVRGTVAAVKTTGAKRKQRR